MDLFVSFTLFVPFDGIPHAGGEYVLRHYRSLARSYSVVVIAPFSEANEFAASRINSEFRVILIGKRTDQLGRSSDSLRLVMKMVRGASWDQSAVAAVRRDRTVHRLVREARTIEFQWTESMSVFYSLRGLQLRHDAIIVLVAHDILSQRWSREVSAAPFPSKLWAFTRLVLARRAETRYFKQASRVVVFSDKDAALARSLVPDVCVDVVPPYLEVPEMLSGRGVDGRRVLFTGAFDRPENVEAATWLIEKVWPQVVSDMPDSELEIVGAFPPDHLRMQAAVHSSVTITGYVDDLSPYYSHAAVFAVPLLRGAGVKFKTITAMLWGIPIVTTSIGAEGIGTPDMYVGITESPDEFAALLKEALSDDETQDSQSARARDWARTHYGRDSFERSLERIYQFVPDQHDPVERQ